MTLWILLGGIIATIVIVNEVDRHKGTLADVLAGGRGARAAAGERLVIACGLGCVFGLLFLLAAL